MSALEREEQFERILAECCQRVRNGESLDSCLVDYPADFHADLAQLVPISTRIGRLAHDPSPDFQRRLEDRLVAEGEHRQRQNARPGFFGGLFRRMPTSRALAVLLIVLIVVFGGGAQVVQASDDSLPDSPLYSVKTAREWVELALAGDENARVTVQTRQVTRRGRELQQAVRTDKSRLVVAALTTRLERTADVMVDQALVAKSSGNPRPSERALVVIREMRQRVEPLIVQASPRQRPPLRRLQSSLDSLEQRLLGGSLPQT